MGLELREEKKGRGIGTVVHRLLAGYYQAKRDGGDITDAIARTIEGLEPRYTPFIERARLPARAYIWKHGRDRTVTLAVERELTVLIEGKVFTRRVDRIVRNGSFVNIIDYKTASDVSTRTRSAVYDWSLATQDVVGRYILPDQYGLEWGGVIMDLIGNTKVEKVSDVKLRRVPLRFPDRMIKAIPVAIAQAYRDIEETEKAYDDPWHWPRSGSCWGRYGLCDYASLCDRGLAAISDYERKLK
jgi:hypothetical protein